MNKPLLHTDRDAAWRRELREALTPRERSAIPRAHMPMLDPAYRITCNEEVNQGLSAGQAVTEATRPAVCHRLPGEHRHPRLYQKHPARRRRRGRGGTAPHQRPAGSMRPRVPPGKAVREPLHIQ